MLIDIAKGRSELQAAHFTRAKIPDDTGEWWTHPSGHPHYHLLYMGERHDCFDAEQLTLVLSHGGPFRPGNTIGGRAVN